jgi:purine-cytosine permease-like protein
MRSSTPRFPRLSLHVPDRLTGAALTTLRNDDYSAGTAAPVPDNARQSRWHLAALWITLAAGLIELALGFGYYRAGYQLPRAIAAAALGGCCYLAYALPAAYLGSRTGRTTALLTRSVFGPAASAVISVMLIAAGLARVALVSGLAAEVYRSLFGLAPVAAIAAAFAFCAVAVNLLGITGLSALARYVAAPLLVAWACYLVIKGAIAPPHHLLAAGPVVATLPFPAGVSAAIVAVSWGNEPDTWRYGQPRMWWPVPAYLAALVAGLVLFVAGGWTLGSVLHQGLAGAPGLAGAFRSGVGYSMFGALWLGGVLAALMLLTVAGAGHYQMTNAAANLVGELDGWRRWRTALGLAVLAALVSLGTASAAGVASVRGSPPGSGLAALAQWAAVTLPSVIVVMCVELLVVRRRALARGRRKAERPLQIPSWRSALRPRSGRSAKPGAAKARAGQRNGEAVRRANWAGFAAVLAAMAFGGYGFGLLPGQRTAPALGFVPLESWLLAGVMYVALSSMAAALNGARSAGVLVVAGTGRVFATAGRVFAKSGQVFAKTGRLFARRAPARSSPVTESAPPPAKPTAAGILAAIRQQGAVPADDSFLPMITSGTAGRDLLYRFAVEQARLRASNRRSFLYLASRSPEPASLFFAELAETERHALDLLAIFADAVRVKGGPGAGDPLPGCHAYPACVAWLALGAHPADTALALTAVRPAWSTTFGIMSRSLRDSPGYGLSERACAFFDLLAAPAPEAEAQTLAIVQRSLDAGQPPARAGVYARLLASYTTMFWTTLAGQAEPARRMVPDPAARTPAFDEATVSGPAGAPTRR